MRLNLLGVGNAALLSVKFKTLDDAGLLNVSALARALGVHRSTFYHVWRLMALGARYCTTRLIRN